MKIYKIIMIVISLIILLNSIVPTVVLAVNEIDEVTNNTITEEKKEDKENENIYENNNVQDNEKIENEDIDNTIEEEETDDNKNLEENYENIEKKEENKKEQIEEETSVNKEIYNINDENALNEKIESQVTSKVKYSSHVQDYGWEEEFSKVDGQLSGTEGKSKRVEALKIKLGNSEEITKNASIKYQVHTQDYGWMNWKQDGEMAGTEGESKRVEALKIKLEGIEGYTVFYRVHVQDYGWMSWKQNGEIAGTEGESKRIEAIQIKIIKTSKIDIQYKYNEIENRVTVTISSDKELKSINDISWQLSSDKRKYTKTFDKNCDYVIELTDIDQIVTKHNIKVNQTIQHKIRYSSYIEGKGWEKEFSRIDGNTSGTTGESKRIEAIKINLGNSEEITQKASIKYQVHMQDYGWMNWKQNGEIAGTIGENKRMEAIKVTIEGMEGYSVIYRVYVQDRGWTSWVNNGGTAGTIGESLRIEAIEMKIVKAPSIKVNYIYNEDNNKVTVKIISNKQLSNINDEKWELSSDKKTYTKTFSSNYDYQVELTDIDKMVTKVNIKITQIVQSKIRYSSHVQDYGWMNWKKDGEVTGTTGESKRVESLKINLGNSEEITKNAKIKYQVHVQDYGWMSWKENGQIAGTMGESKRIEAIRIKLEGVENYSVRYRTHVQNVGWTSWSYDGILSGTEGRGLRVEAIQIEIVDKIKRKSNFYDLDESKYPGYKEQLHKLQEKYPDWILTIKYTGLNWNTVIENEYGFVGESPRSLTQAPYLNEWKSSEDNNKYDVSQTWYRASKSAIAYMMDPRNSLEEAWIFQFQDLSSSAGTKANIQKMVAGTFLNTDSIINTILATAQEQGISPFHLVSRMIQEQYRDGSGIMNGYKHNGRIVYNLFNINVSGNTSAGITAGAQYAYERHWFTPETCIMGSAEFLKKNYINKGQSTLYFQKYNVVDKNNLYNHQYMQNIRAANDEGNAIYKSYRDNKLLDSQFEFVIPVYENMPSSACPRPKT